MIAVHLLILAHLAHWLLAGESIGRFVLSDAMQTLELGRVNPGFLLFVLAILVTLVGGRWLCGWACHMGALQDSCAWLLRRCGCTPRPLRLRLLGYVPYALAFYMFLWPTLRREAIVPALERFWPAAATWIGPPVPFPGFTLDLVSSRLWQGLPGIAVAIPFLLICGGATVFFLGNRGFCRYGCPYGGVFRALEPLAPVRVRVDLDSCDGCGRCTAACSSGISVHQEVRAFGRVTSSACTKTMDCIAACPQDALSLGPTWPGLLKGPAPTSLPAAPRHTSILEEVALLGVFIATLLITRGLYGAIPLLMAVGIAICTAAIAALAWRTLRGRFMTLAGRPVRRRGRLTGAGIAVLAAAAIATILLLHSAAVRAVHRLGSIAERDVAVSRADVFGAASRPRTPESLEAAQAALRWYRLGSSWRRGGFALFDTPEIRMRLAWMQLVTGDATGAEATLRDLLHGPLHSDALTAEHARIILLQGDVDRAAAGLREALAQDGGFIECRDLLAGLLVSAGRKSEARSLYEQRLAEVPSDTECRISFGGFLLRLREFGSARQHLQLAVRDDPRSPRARIALARACAAAGEVDKAIHLLRQAEADLPFAADHFRAEAARISGP